MPKTKIMPIVVVLLLLFCAQGCSQAVETSAPPNATSPAENTALLSPTPTTRPTQPLTLEMYRGNLERNGVFTTKAPVEDASLLWQAEGGASGASAALVSNLLFIGSPEGLNALDSQTGSLVWHSRTGGAVNSAPAFWSDLLFVGGADGVFYALKSQSGEQQWTFRTGGPISASPAADKSGVYFGSMDGYFYALNPQTGQELWKFAVGGISDPASGITRGFQSTPALSGSTLVFASAQHGGASAELSLYAVDKASGKLLWEYSDWNQITGPAIADGVVYIGGFGAFTGLNLQDGSPAFSFTADIVSSAPAVTGGLAFFGCDDGFLYAVDLRSGELKWRFNSGDAILSAPSVSGNLVYFGSGSGTFYGIDIPSGQAMWIYETGKGISSSPLIADGIVYFSNDNGAVYALK